MNSRIIRTALLSSAMLLTATVGGIAATVDFSLGPVNYTAQTGNPLVWTIQQNIFLNDPSSAVLNINTFYADDRAVLSINGTRVVGTGINLNPIGNPTNAGSMVFTSGGPLE